MKYAIKTCMSANHSGKCRLQSGFTMVEVMVAISLLGIGMTAAYYAINMAMQVRKFSHDHYVGTLIANNRIEFAKNQPFSQLVNLGEPSKQVNDYGEESQTGRFFRSTTITTAWPGNSNLTAITVHVRVPHARIGGAGGGTASVSTLLRRN